MKKAFLCGLILLCSLSVACSKQQNTATNAEQINMELSSAVQQILGSDVEQKKQGYQVILKYAEQNNADAIYHLGQFYIEPSRLDGIITPDAKKAEELLLKSAKMNHVSSQSFLGITYKWGAHQFPRDKEKSCYWLKKSVESESNPVIEGLMKDCK